MMRKKKRVSAVLLLLALLFPLCAAFAGCGEERTDGEETSSETTESGEPSSEPSSEPSDAVSDAVSDGKTDVEPDADAPRLEIAHINVPNQNEGDMVIISGSRAQKLGDLGNFAWWCAYVFDWDAEQGCFVLTDAQTNAANYDKSDVQIPQYGFAYCINKGNDYSSSGGINYISKRVSESYDLALKTKVGTKAYLYGTHLYSGTVQTNGELWYTDDFETDAFLTLGAPLPDGEPYDPVASWGQDVARQIHTTQPDNEVVYANGECLLFEPSYGSFVTYNYSWWYGLVFAWDASQDCYVCVATDFNLSAESTKDMPLPPNGFVVLDCASGSKESVTACTVGTKAWLYDDPDGNRLISLNFPEDGHEPVLLGDAGKDAQLSAPQFTESTGKFCPEEGCTVSWEPVEGAESYTVSLHLSMPNTFNKMLSEPQTTSETAFTVPANLAEIGNAYTVTVYANGTDAASASVPAFSRLYCVSKQALDGALVGKTVVAFGDSLTARNGWVNLLGGYIGTEVINAGVGGDTSTMGKARFEADVLSRKPDVTLICFGTNDQAQQTASGVPLISVEEYTANLTYFVTELQKIGSDVIFICPPGKYGLDYAYGNLDDFCDAMRQVALAYGCDIIDIRAEVKKGLDLTSIVLPGDGMHQSDAGHAYWTSYISAYLNAKYDGVDASTVKVVCKDESGKELESYEFTVASGAYLQVPAKPIDGMTLVGEEQIVKGGETVTYTYRSN